MEAAERRFFNDWAAAGQGRSSGPGGNLPPRLPLSPTPTFHTPPIVGLFPEPGASR
jgi:hypothetical protein